MAACDELESLILDRAAGALPPEEAAALQAHLDGCGQCRTWLASCEEAVRLAALPEPSEAELKVFARLPARARAAFRERKQGSSWGRPLVAATLGAAAAAALLLVTPLRGTRHAPDAMAVDDADSSGLMAWALSDPLEDQGLTALSDEGLDDDSVEPSDAAGLDLDWEQTE